MYISEDIVHMQWQDNRLNQMILTLFLLFPKLPDDSIYIIVLEKLKMELKYSGSFYALFRLTTINKQQ